MIFFNEAWTYELVTTTIILDIWSQGDGSYDDILSMNISTEYQLTLSIHNFWRVLRTRISRTIFKIPRMRSCTCGIPFECIDQITLKQKLWNVLSHNGLTLCSMTTGKTVSIQFVGHNSNVVSTMCSMVKSIFPNWPSSVRPNSFCSFCSHPLLTLN